MSDRHHSEDIPADSRALWSDGHAYGPDGPPPPVKRINQHRRKDKFTDPALMLEAQQRWMNQHPAARCAWELYMTGQHEHMVKAAREATQKFPGDLSQKIILRHAARYRWVDLRAMYLPKIKTAADYLQTRAQQTADEIVRDMQHELELLKPGRPKDPREKVKFLRTLQDNIQKKLLEDPGGTQALNSFKLWKMVLSEIDESTRPIDYRDDDTDDLVALAAMGKKAVDMEPFDVEPAPLGKTQVSPDFAAQIEAQIAEHEAALAGDDPHITFLGDDD